MYYKDPKPGQPGLDVMPRPPFDRGGPHEDAKGLRWHCRCWMTAVLAPIDSIVADPGRRRPFETATGAVVPDPATYSEWFAGADVRRRRAAVGVRRYATATDVLGREPEWVELVSAETGRLLTVDELRNEGAGERAARVAKVRAIVQANRRRAASTARYGFVMPGTK